MIRRVIYSNFLCVNTVTNKKYRLAAVLFIGGLEEIRTPDPHNANVVRSQLRYKPVCRNYTAAKCVCQAGE